MRFQRHEHIFPLLLWAFYWVLIFVMPGISMATNAQAKAALLPDNLNAKYGKWLNLPISELIHKGRIFLYQQNCPDSALVCFSIAAARYKDTMDAAEKAEIYQAYIGKWYAQFFHYYDYPKAYESLLQARKICDKTGRGRGMVDFNLSMMYQVFATDGHDPEAEDQAEALRRKAMDEAIAEKDTNVVHMVFSNMVSSVTELKKLHSLEPELKKYENFTRGDTNPMSSFNTVLFAINMAIARDQYGKALTLLDRQLDYISPTQPRYIISNLMTRADIYSRQRKYNDGIEALKEAERIADEGGMNDALLNIYDALHSLYDTCGQRDKSAEVYHRYLSIKDSLLNYRQIAGVSQIHFISEMDRMEDALTQAEYKRRIQLYIVALCVAVIVVVLFFLVTILRKNKKLAAANRSLYEKNQLWLDKETSELTPKTDITASEPASVNIQDPESGTGTEDKPSQPDPKRISAFMERIRQAASNAEEIYSPGFTVSKLAEIVGLPVKQVSRTINETTGDNFNTFINRYRIKRACHMLDDIDTYGNKTIENIALSVGFRSRTAFISSFKKATGLNPSDYLKAALEIRVSKHS